MPHFFATKLRVRLSETDALGVVYYGQFLTFFDLARLEMLREAGITLGSLNGRKVGFVAAESRCRYHSSARFDDELTLKVRVAKLGSTSVNYSHRIEKGRKLVAEGEVTDVLVDGEGKPTPIPKDIRARLSKYSG